MEPMDDDELERMLAELKRVCDASFNARAEDILARIDEAQPVEVGDQGVVLLGFEGNIDAVWQVREPRPYVLRRPLPQRLSAAMVVDPDPTVLHPLPVAEYRRIGEFTYQRDR